MMGMGDDGGVDATTSTRSGRDLRVSLGLIAGLLLGFVGYLPTVLLWQDYWDVPQPRVYPQGSFGSFGSDPPPVEYWVSWAAPAMMVVAFGLATFTWRAGRQFALSLVCAFLPIAALVAWFFIGMELFFAPD